MNKLAFTKLQSIGNDFVLVEGSEVETLAQAYRRIQEQSGRGGVAAAVSTVELAEQVDAFLPTLARAMCDRRLGIGGDGLLVLTQDEESRLWLRMFNPDGTEDFCGNGLRCAAQYAIDRGYAGGEFTIHHGDIWVPIRQISNGWLRTTLGPATYEPGKVPHKLPTPLLDVPLSSLLPGSPSGYTASALSTGSTHLVIRGKLPSESDFQHYSPLLEVHDAFPRSTSVIWTEEVGPTEVKLRIWERGVGETLGCGTGSTAAAVDTVRRLGRPAVIHVQSRGGVLRIDVPGLDLAPSLEGRAEKIFEGIYNLPDNF